MFEGESELDSDDVFNRRLDYFFKYNLQSNVGRPFYQAIPHFYNLVKQRKPWEEENVLRRSMLGRGLINVLAGIAVFFYIPFIAFRSQLVLHKVNLQSEDEFAQTYFHWVVNLPPAILSGVTAVVCQLVSIAFFVLESAVRTVINIASMMGFGLAQLFGLTEKPYEPPVSFTPYKAKSRRTVPRASDKRSVFDWLALTVNFILSSSNLVVSGIWQIFISLPLEFAYHQHKAMTALAIALSIAGAVAFTILTGGVAPAAAALIGLAQVTFPFVVACTVATSIIFMNVLAPCLSLMVRAIGIPPIESGNFLENNVETKPPVAAGFIEWLSPRFMLRKRAPKGVPKEARDAAKRSSSTARFLSGRARDLQSDSDSQDSNSLTTQEEIPKPSRTGMFSGASTDTSKEDKDLGHVLTPSLSRSEKDDD